MFSKVINAWRYRRKTHVTPAEFIAALEADLGRELDTNSAFFFRQHAATVDLVNQMLQGSLREDRIDGERHALVMQMMLLEISSCVPEVATLAAEGRLRLSPALSALSKTYPDAGNVIGQALVAYLRSDDQH